MHSVSDIPVLVITYQRLENLTQIINRCLANGIKDIFVSVDGPKSGNPKTHLMHSQIVSFLEKLQFEPSINLRTRILAENIGCSASVLNSIDWFFENVEFGIVLEDDCIPESDFFFFVSKGLDFLNTNSKIMMISGSQFWSSENINHNSFLSRYPNVWGWATTKTRWEIVASLMNQDLNRKNFTYPWFSKVDEIFWFSGMRRAAQGYLDAWDAILGYVFHTNNFLTLLPGKSLIKNIGNDEFASHKMSDNFGIRIQPGVFSCNSIEPLVCLELDKWLRRYIYKINFLRLITTKITFLFDLVGLNKLVKKPIRNQWRIH